MSYRRPPLAVFIDTVKRYDKRVGLRKLYKDYEVPAELRQNFRDMWDKIAGEIEHASEKRETEATDGNGPPQSGEGQPKEPGSPENEPKTAPRVHGNERKAAKKPKKKKTKKKKALKS